MPIGKKTGPKTDNPKNIKISVKLDQKAKEILDSYCKQEAISSGETIRRGIYKLEEDLKK